MRFVQSAVGNVPIVLLRSLRSVSEPREGGGEQMDHVTAIFSDAEAAERSVRELIDEHFNP